MDRWCFSPTHASETMSDRIALENALRTRAGDQCELSKSEGLLSPFPVSPYDDDAEEHNVLISDFTRSQLEGRDADLDPKHWFSLQETIWSEVPAVQVLAWRMLNRLRNAAWAQDVLDQAYLTDEVLDWARQGLRQAPPSGVRTLDSNGTELSEGDSITLIKDLDVKGTSFVAKRGTLVKGIRLTDNPDHVEGRVNSIIIVLKTAFLKKA